jgi:peroxiredoxin
LAGGGSLLDVVGVTMSQRLERNIAPDFSLADTYGNIIRLSDYWGKKHIVLVFTRGFA